MVEAVGRPPRRNVPFPALPEPPGLEDVEWIFDLFAPIRLMHVSNKDHLEAAARKALLKLRFVDRARLGGLVGWLGVTPGDQFRLFDALTDGLTWPPFAAVNLAAERIYDAGFVMLVELRLGDRLMLNAEKTSFVRRDAPDKVIFWTDLSTGWQHYGSVFDVVDNAMYRIARTL